MDRTTELALAATYVYSRPQLNRAGIPPDWQLARFANGEGSGVAAQFFGEHCK
jgi:hypothetical protein